MLVETVTHNEKETGGLAASLAKECKPGDVFALIGELGCGKTLFTKFFAAELGITEDITSPTFNLVEEYEGTLMLYHFDLYRIEHDDEFDMLAFEEEYWYGEGVSLIEWADRALSRLPEHTVIVRFDYIDASSRRITVEYPDN